MHNTWHSDVCSLFVQITLEHFRMHTFRSSQNAFLTGPGNSWRACSGINVFCMFYLDDNLLFSWVQNTPRTHQKHAFLIQFLNVSSVLPFEYDVLKYYRSDDIYTHLQELSSEASYYKHAFKKEYYEIVGESRPLSAFFPNMLISFYKNAFLIMKLSNPPSFRAIQS